MSSPFTYFFSKRTTKSEIAEPPHINSAHVSGEPWTGYEDGDNKGEFECGNCEYYERETSSCGQEDMKLHSKQPKVAGSDRIVVDKDGCCEYINRIGIDDVDKK